MKDFSGHELSGASAKSVELLERGMHELRCYIDDPVATVDAALAESPALVMGHALRAYLHLLGTEPAGIPVAQASLEAARALPANARERAHLQAIEHLVHGRWRAAGLALEDLSLEYPRDALALQAGHSIDFFTGDARMLRDRLARALPRWSKEIPGYHAALGMYAFGLEETGDYARAELFGRRAVELEPRDGWAQHAVAHVMEMQNRRRDGVAWMNGNYEGWSRASFFTVHNHWHLALFHLGLGEVEKCLELYDRHVYGERSPLALNMIDASAMLWRLSLLGIDPGGRWQPLADNWAPFVAAKNYAFNDVHAAIAFVGAGRMAEVARVLEAQREAMASEGDNAQFTREVGHPLVLAFQAFGEQRYAECVQLLRPVRSHAQRFGGSHAQRELIDLTLLAAASRAGMPALAEALHAERVATGRPVGDAPLQKAA